MMRPQRAFIMAEMQAWVSRKAPVRLVREDVVPVAGASCAGEAVLGDAGVVDQDVDGAEVGEDGFGAGLDGVFAGDVEGEGFGGAAGGGDFGGDGFELVEIAGGEGDGGAVGGECEGAGAADALGGSGDEGNSCPKVPCHAPVTMAHRISLSRKLDSC